MGKKKGCTKSGCGRRGDLGDFARTLADVRSVKEMNDFLQCILTPSERSRLALRWELVGLLEQGISQRRIARMLGISLCKITRGSRELKRGPAGFRRIVRRSLRTGGK